MEIGDKQSRLQFHQRLWWVKLQGFIPNFHLSCHKLQIPLQYSTTKTQYPADVSVKEAPKTGDCHWILLDIMVPQTENLFPW